MKAGNQPFYNSSIPSDWTTPEFGEVFTFLKSYSFSREQLSDEKTTDEVQNIHYGDIHATFENEILDFEIEKRIPFVKDGLINTDKLNDEEFPFLKDGDLIIADASEDTVGVAESIELKNVNSRKIVSGLHTFAARDKNGKTVAGYRTYLLRHPQVIRELRRIATGFSVFGISKTSLGKVKLPLPPPNEQKAFAELLFLMDTAINITNQLIAIKELNMIWIRQQLLSGKKRLSGFTAQWDEVNLGDIGEFKNGINKDKEEFGHGHPLVGLMDVFGIPKVFNTKFSLVNSSENERRNFDLRKGDVLFVRSSVKPVGVGLTTLVSEDIPDATFSGFLIRFRANEKLDFEFKEHCFFERDFRQRLLNKSTISANTNINQVALKSLSILLPPLQEQRAISQVLHVMNKEIQLLKSKTIKLREKKKGLMQQLLTGKKRLKVK